MIARRTTAVVFGGAGFLGSHLCEALLADGHAVVCIDNFCTGTAVNVAHLGDDPRFELVEHDVTIAVLALPSGVAQSVCDRLVHAGVSSILNFAPVVLSVPPHVHLRKVDLAAELQILSFHETRKAATALAPGSLSEVSR